MIILHAQELGLVLLTTQLVVPINYSSSSFPKRGVGLEGISMEEQKETEKRAKMKERREADRAKSSKENEEFWEDVWKKREDVWNKRRIPYRAQHQPPTKEALIQSNGHPILWRVLLKLGGMTHLAYDAPKKVSAAQVIAAARAVLSEAGLHVRMARSTWSSACALLTSELPQYSHRPWEDCKLDEVAETLGVRLGMVWIPQGETILGKIAGQWLRHTLMALARKKTAQTPLSWRQCAKTSMLLEISCFLVRKLGEHIPEVTDPNFTSVLKERWQRCRSVPVAKLASLPRTDLF